MFFEISDEFINYIIKCFRIIDLVYANFDVYVSIKCKINVL